MQDKHKNQEQIYRCDGWPATEDQQARPCGSLWPESAVEVRPDTRRLYCRTCNSERLRLVTEETDE